MSPRRISREAKSRSASVRSGRRRTASRHSDSARRFVVLQVKGNSQLVMRDSVVGVVAQRSLQGVHRSGSVILPHLNLSLVNQRIHVVTVGLEHLVVQLGGLVEAVLQDQ